MFSMKIKLEKFVCRYPAIEYFVVCLGIPVCMIGTVFVGTAVMLLPISWILGWR
ncbi:MAG: hypothetical protein RSE05_02950 [Clostridium sp.]